MEVIEEVSMRGAFIMQADNREFESRLASYVGSTHAIGVGNATDGLEFSWLAIGLEKGDEVILSSHTMVATASAVVTAGGTPVPVGIGDDWLIDPDAIEAAITPRTVGISPTQLNGRTCNMDRIMQIAEKHKLAVVEDSAQALGSKYKGKNAGTFGVAGSFSFFPAKVLGALGDAGGVVTSEERIFEKIYQLHDHGRDYEGNTKSWGRNSRLDNLQAAILNYKFKSYDEVVTRRREIANIYHERLSTLEELKLPPAPNSSPDHYDVYQNYELLAENRDLLKSYLAENGVGTLIQWGGKGVHQWEALGFDLRIPSVERFFEKSLMLPINMFVSDDDLHYVCDVIENFYARVKMS
jgi:dTDP-4-amino-4,6-dideoxygalactose transaminase